jgi:CRISPR-associated protein Cas1
VYTLLNTLYVMTPNAYAHLENNTLRIDVEHEKKLQVPLHHLGSLVCFGNVMVSPALMHRLADEGNRLVLLDDNGRFKARLEGPVSGNILLRQAQHRSAAEAAFALEFARACVAGKLKNSRARCCSAARAKPPMPMTAAAHPRADNLAASLRACWPSAVISTGCAASKAKPHAATSRRSISSSNRRGALIFALDGRTRRPPLDRFNALLSFLYAMLMNDCRSALEAVGLDPQLGFLHAVRPAAPRLALDLQEEFRPLADRLALTLINREQVKRHDFDEREGGAVHAERQRPAQPSSPPGRNASRKKSPTRCSAQPLALGLIPLVQARLLARHIRGETEGYLPFIAR